MNIKGEIMLDFIKKLFNNNKTNTQIIITDLNKEYKSLEKLEIGLYTINSEPLKDKNLISFDCKGMVEISDSSEGSELFVAVYFI